MEFSMCMVVSKDKGILVYLGHTGAWYEIKGFRDGQLHLVRLS